MALNYYKVAKAASLQIGNHPGLLYLQQLCRSASRILDAGCGEGSRLHTLLPKNKFGWGIDINPKAISLAKDQYPRHKFLLSLPTKFPFPNNHFDVVYSAFVLEHTQDPERFLTEMLRVCQPGGQVVVLAPNFGAPNRRSPNSIEDPIIKFFHGLYDEFSSSTTLNWTAVKPKKEYDRPDADTTLEPYLKSLNNYLKFLGVKVLKCSSLWQLEPLSFNLRKLAISILGKMNLPPFKYWGPQIFVVVQKL